MQKRGMKKKMPRLKLRNIMQGNVGDIENFSTELSSNKARIISTNMLFSTDQAEGSVFLW